jgi:hypothetical protein
LDLAWSADGYTLYAASYDGSMAVVTFTESEIGQVTRGDMKGLFETYKKPGVVESVEQLAVEALHARKENADMVITSPLSKRVATFQPVPRASVPVQSSQEILAGQKETITQDGKKRIQPVFLTSPSRQPKPVGLPLPPTGRDAAQEPAPINGGVSIGGLVGNAAATNVSYILPTITASKRPVTISIPTPRPVFTLSAALPGSNVLYTLEVKNSLKGIFFRQSNYSL